MEIKIHLPCRFQPISMSEPGGVYLMALSMILMSTCTISLASIWAKRNSPPLCTCRWYSALFRLMCRRASATTSSISSVDSRRFILPSSSRLTDSRFSTRLISHMASS